MLKNISKYSKDSFFSSTKICSFRKVIFENFSISENSTIWAEATKVLQYPSFCGSKLHEIELPPFDSKQILPV